MVAIRPFKAFRPTEEWVEKVAAPPYDIVTREDVRQILSINPHSFLQITRPDGYFSEGVPSDDTRVYDRASENLSESLQKKIFVQDACAAYYIYSQTCATHTQTGLTCLASLEDYAKGLIKKHEKTRAAKLKDRITHMKALHGTPEPVFLCYRNTAAIREQFEKITHETKPLLHFTTKDQVTHKVWPVNESTQIEALTQAFGAVDCLYIADGHHRAEATYQAMQQDSNAGILSILFPEEDLHILGYHRIVNDISPWSEESFLDRLREDFFVDPVESESYIPETQGKLGLYLANNWWSLKPRVVRQENPQDPIKGLDVSILQDQILAPLLGIQDPRTSPLIDFIGGLDALSRIKVEVDGNPRALAFTVHPVTTNTLMQTADQEGLMPPKSTWFEPKLLSGLFFHLLEH